MEARVITAVRDVQDIPRKVAAENVTEKKPSVKRTSKSSKK
jgi:hypothetical protein